MGLFDKIFGKPDPRAGILHGGIALADETERIYRNQLESISPTGAGLLKARLISSTFASAVYLIGGCGRGRSEEDTNSFFSACSGIAMQPFHQPGFHPSVSQQEAVSIASSFVMPVLRLIMAESEEGPSTLDHKTEAFKKLIGIYHDCLAESAGTKRYNALMRHNLETAAESIIWTHFRFLANTLQQIR